ncbi:hypothetical protein FRC08_009450 [Ceratobasidium sp. 394]|nr:hypothetical protein FRC08_009450 [Ceratobasidium sp. 394]
MDDAGVVMVYLPLFCARSIPQFERLIPGNAKQYRHLETVLYVVLFEAWRDSNEISDDPLPRSGSNMRAYEHQQ